MEKDLINSILIKVVPIVFGCLLTIVGWFVKIELTQMTSTLQEIKKDVQEMNKETILLKARVEYKIKFVEKDLDDLRKDFQEFKSLQGWRLSTP